MVKSLGTRNIVKDPNFRDNLIYSNIKFKENVIETLPKQFLKYKICLNLIMILKVLEKQHFKVKYYVIKS